MKSKFYEHVVGLSAKSTVDSLRLPMFLDFPLCFGALQEQQAIATFLDRETSRIDSLVEKKQQFIELLEERRSALISHAVTKGLDPDVPMKDSGIEWIGEIPEHWDVTKLKRVLKEKLKYGANESAEQEDNIYPRYIRITDFDSYGCLRDDTFKSLPLNKANDYLLNDGDVLFARSGATVGKTFQFKNYEGKACFAGYLIKASPNPNIIHSDYLYLYTKSNSYTYWKNSIFSQATIENISADKYQYLDIPLPSIQEQQAIADYLDRETSQLDTLITKTETSIEYLKEYRTALISSAVTGKIDVRGTVSD